MGRGKVPSFVTHEACHSVLHLTAILSNGGQAETAVVSAAISAIHRGHRSILWLDDVGGLEPFHIIAFVADVDNLKSGLLIIGGRYGRQALFGGQRCQLSVLALLLLFL